MLTEADVRNLVVADVLPRAGKFAESVFEFWVPRSNERADVAVVGEIMHGLEIKTARDSLKRLPRQIEAYSRVFDRCEAVVATRHVEGALEMLPSWWGLRAFEDEGILHTLRHPEVNDAVEPEILVRLLWRAEAFAAVSELDRTPSPKTGRHELWEILLAALDVDALRDVVRRALLTRDPSTARVPTRRFAVT